MADNNSGKGLSRREVLTGTGAGLTALAGCLDNRDRGDPNGDTGDGDGTPVNGDDDSSNGNETNGNETEPGNGNGDNDDGDGDGDPEPSLELAAEFLDGEDVVLDTRNRFNTVQADWNYNTEAGGTVNVEVTADGYTLLEEMDAEPGEAVINLNYTELLENTGPGDTVIQVEAAAENSDSDGTVTDSGETTIQVIDPENMPYDLNTERILEGMNILPGNLEKWYVTDGKTLRNMTDAEYGGVDRFGRCWTLPFNLEDKIGDDDRLPTLDEIMSAEYVDTTYDNLFLSASYSSRGFSMARFDEVDWEAVDSQFLSYLQEGEPRETPGGRELPVYQLGSEENDHKVSYIVDRQNDMIIYWGNIDHLDDDNVLEDGLQSLYGGESVLGNYPEIEDTSFMDKHLFAVSGGRFIPRTSPLGDRIGFVGREYDGIVRVYDEDDNVIRDTERAFTPGGPIGAEGTADPVDVSENWLGR